MQLNKKNEEKNRILDEVKKTETYNSAKEILEKFAAESPPKQNVSIHIFITFEWLLFLHYRTKLILFIAILFDIFYNT